MSAFATYTKSLMDAAKGFRCKALETPEGDLKQAYLRAALLHAFSFLEAHLNYMSEHFEKSDLFTVHEKGILLERDVVLKAGEFTLTEKSKFWRLTERIDLLVAKCSSDPAEAKKDWHSKLSTALSLRNALVHPRQAHALTVVQVTEAMQAILRCVNQLYKDVFQKAGGLPYTKKSIDGGLVIG